MKPLYETVVADLHRLVQPVAMYDVLDVRDRQSGCLKLANNLAFTSDLMVRQLARAEQLAVAICTIGPQFEQKASSAFEYRHALQGLIYDIAGSLAVAQVARQVSERIQAAAVARGTLASFSISPGSAGCTLDDQHTVFELLPAERIGVQLTSAGCMFPTKSISLVIGLGPNVPSALDVSQCDFCPKRATCPALSLRDPHVFGDANIARHANRRKEETPSPHTASSLVSKQPKNPIQ